MVLLQYFQPVPREELPNSEGPLSAIVPSTAICIANDCTRSLPAEGVKKRCSYIKLSSEKRAKIGKYTSENSVAAAARHYSKQLPKPLSESTIYGTKKTYLQEVVN